MSTKAVKLEVSNVGSEFSIAVKSLSLPVAKAAQGAIKEAGALLKTEARRMIGEAGFSKRFQNAYRVTVYPERGFSINASAFGLFQHIKYSDIFSLGGKITGSPLLWIPFKTTPKLDRRKSAADIEDYKAKGIKLVSMTSKNGRPLMGERITMSASMARRGTIKLTVSDVRTGAKKTKTTKGLVTKTVPLFFGMRSVTIRQRFSWERVVIAVQSQVPGLYSKQIAKLADE